MTSRFLRLRLGCVSSSFFALQLLAPPAHSQWSHDPHVNNPVCTAAGFQSEPSIVTDGSGGAIISWVDYRRAVDSADIYAQRIDAAGAVRWTTDGASISTAGVTLGIPSISEDGTGGAVVAWEDNRNGAISDVFAQRIDSAGNTHWGSNGLLISTGSSFVLSHSPAVAGDGAGGAIVTWRDVRSGSNYYDIFAQRLNPAGEAQWDANGMAICSAEGAQNSPAIVSDGAGGAIISWEDIRSGTNYDIYSQRVNAAGLVQWVPDGVPVSRATNDQRAPIAALGDGTGGAIFAWNDQRSVTDEDIYAQRIDSAGVTLWDTNGVAISAAGVDQAFPIIVSDGRGGAIVAWSDDRAGTYDAFVQRVNSAGTVQWTADGVEVKSVVSSPEVTIDGTGGAIVTWYKFGDVYAQHVDSSGILKWDTSGVAISIAAGGQSNPVIVDDGTGSAIIAWTDGRNGTDGDIYAQKVGSDGTLGEVTDVLERPVRTHGFTLHQNYPNPFNPRTAIRYELPGSSHVTLAVYDVLGREVALLVNETQPAGAHVASFEATSLSSGAYFYRLQAGKFIDTKRLLLVR
jgi:hypothetical protein